MESTLALAIPLPELILRTGRLQGARRLLKAPITFIGSQKGNDIRLNVEAVQPVHCVVAVGPDGPIVRSWNNARVFVNDAAIHVQALDDGDILQIGPFEFEIRIAAPMALPVDDHVAPSISHDRLEEIRALHKQLSDARGAFRRERSEQRQNIAHQLDDLAESRDSSRQRQHAAEQERSRLLQLRKRFIRRWKKHWSSERIRIAKEADRLVRERSALESQQSHLQAQIEQTGAQAKVQQGLIDHGWQQLRAAQQQWKDHHTKQQTALDVQKHSINEQDSRLQSERASFHRERMQLEHHTAQMRIEADGLESRIVNLRAVLLQLEADRRPQWPPLEYLPAERDVAKAPAIEERLANLDRLIGEVSDQRRVLLEQTDRLAEAREAWREEERRLVGEMEQLGERLRIWEERLIEREDGASLEVEALERDRANLRQLSDRLESWQARLGARDLQLHEETSRLELELHQKSQRLERREIALADLSLRWGQRRRAEVQQLRTEHRRCAKLRMDWERQQAGNELRQRVLLQQQRDLAAQSLAVERTRQRVVSAADDPRVAAKKLERLQRHLQRANGKRDELLEQRWQELRLEREKLVRLFEQSNKGIEQIASREREIANRLAEAECREHRVTVRDTALSETEAIWKLQRESYERECAELRDEIDRLAGLLIEAGSTEPVPLARAG